MAAFKAWAEANPEKIEAFEKKVDEAVNGLPSAKRSAKRKMMEGRRVEMALGIKNAAWDSWKIYADAIDHFTFFEK